MMIGWSLGWGWMGAREFGGEGGGEYCRFRPFVSVLRGMAKLLFRSAWKSPAFRLVQATQLFSAARMTSLVVLYHQNHYYSTLYA